MKYLMQYLSILMLILSINTVYAQRYLQYPVLDSQCKKVVDSMIVFTLKKIQSLEALLEEKEINKNTMLQQQTAHTAKLKTQLLHVDLELIETQIALSNLQTAFKKEKKKNFWRTVGVGAGSLAAGFIVGSLVTN